MNGHLFVVDEPKGGYIDLRDSGTEGGDDTPEDDTPETE